MADIVLVATTVLMFIIFCFVAGMLLIILSFSRMCCKPGQKKAQGFFFVSSIISYFVYMALGNYWFLSNGFHTPEQRMIDFLFFALSGAMAFMGINVLVKRVRGAINESVDG